MKINLPAFDSKWQRVEPRDEGDSSYSQGLGLGERISTMYIDKLDGKISGDFFDKLAGQWREEQRRLKHDIDRHEEAEQSYMNEGLRILELARNAQALFERQPAREKRRLLNFVLSNCSWEDGEVVATFRQRSDLLAETTAVAACSSAVNGGNSSKNGIWLPFLNTYRTMCVAQDPEFRQLLQEIRTLDVAA